MMFSQRLVTTIFTMTQEALLLLTIQSLQIILKSSHLVVSLTCLPLLIKLFLVKLVLSHNSGY